MVYNFEKINIWVNVIEVIEFQVFFNLFLNISDTHPQYIKSNQSLISMFTIVFSTPLLEFLNSNNLESIDLIRSQPSFNEIGSIKSFKLS